MEIKKNRIVATPRSKYHKYLFGGSSGSSSGGSISIDTNNFVKKTGETSQTVEGDFVATGSIVAKYMAESYVPDFPIAGNSVLGLIKVGANLNIDPDGVLSATGGGSGVSSFNDLTDKPTTLSGYGILATDTLFDSKYAGSSHTHNYLSFLKVGTTTYNVSSNGITIPAYPTSLPASDVYSWAKAANKPSYTYSEVGAAAASHTHTGIYQPLDNDLTAIAGLTSTGLLKRTGTDSWTLDTTSYLPSASYTAADVLSKIKTVDGSGSGLDADLLDGKEATAFVLSSDILYSSSGNYATYANKIPRLDSTLGALEIGQFIDLHGTTTSTDYTHRLISYGDGFQIKTPSGTYSYVFDNTGKFTAPGAIVAKYQSSSYTTDWPLMSNSIAGIAIAGQSLILTDNKIDVGNRHYTNTSTYTDGKARSITAEISIGTGTMVNTESISITLSFLPVTISYGVVATLIANASTWTGVGMKVSLVKGGTYWIAFVTNDLGVTVSKDGIYLSISAKQTV